LLIFATTAAAQSQQSEIIPLPHASWQFHYGDDPRCGTVSGAGCTLQPYDDVSTAAEPRFWARTVVRLPDALRTPQQLGVLIEGDSSFYEVFINGHLIGSRGDLERARSPYNARAIFPFSSTLAEDGTLVVCTRNSVFVRNHLRPFTSALASAIGPPQPLQGRFAENTAYHLRAQWQHYLCYLLVFCIGLFFLLLYFLDRDSREYLWLALLLCAVSSIRCLEFASVVDVKMGAFSSEVLFSIANLLIPFSAIQFGFSLVKRPVWPFFRLIQFAPIIVLFPFLVLLPFPDSEKSTLLRLGQYTSRLININALISSLALVVPLPSCFKNPRAEMRWIGGALLFLCFEDVDRQLTILRARGPFPIPLIPLQLPIGDLQLDLRALAYLLFATVMMIAMTVRFRRLQSRNRQVELDLEAARTVQHLLIPSQAPETPGFTIESVYVPAQEVGGDFFHVAPAPDGSVLLVVGDVSGKGLSAAMSVSVIIGALRSNPAREPSQVLTQLNQAVYGFISGFATCCVALLTPEGQLTLANAGHLNPYRNGAELTLSGSLPLGLAGDVTYTSEDFSLEPGDHLAFVSDGVVESTGRKGELFGFERTAAISSQSAQRIADAAQSFGEGAQADDITVLTLVCTVPQS